MKATLTDKVFGRLEWDEDTETYHGSVDFPPNKAAAFDLTVHNADEFSQREFAAFLSAARSHFQEDLDAEVGHHTLDRLHPAYRAVDLPHQGVAGGVAAGHRRGVDVGHHRHPGIAEGRACKQLGHAKRLHHIVVRAGLQQAYFLVLARDYRKYDDRTFDHERSRSRNSARQLRAS